MVYKGIQGCSTVYKSTLGFTRYTGVYKGILGFTRVYYGSQGCTRAYKVC